MATSTLLNSRCSTCNKAIGTFTCRGCQLDYCIIHATEHRQMLALQMDEDVVSLHDQLQENILQQTIKVNDHPLMKQIDQWEIDSIEKIRQTSNDLRKQLLNVFEKHTNKIKEDLEGITQELKRARNNDQFFENDLKEWMKKLDQLSNELNTSQTISIEYQNNITPFISNISIKETPDISNECFDQTIGNIQIKENGSVIIHNQINTYASVRGKRDYIQGQHHLRFKIEHLTNNWIFFGIVSKDGSIPDYPSIGKTAHGWSGSNYLWRDGIRDNGFNSDFQTNDIIELSINCDQRTIQLTNERTHNTHMINVDINDSPFPWKISIGLFHSPGECIRLLS